MDDLDDLLNEVNEVVGSDCTSNATFGGPKAIQSQVRTNYSQAKPVTQGKNQPDDFDALMEGMGEQSMLSSALQSSKSNRAGAAAAATKPLDDDDFDDFLDNCGIDNLYSRSHVVQPMKSVPKVNQK